MGVHDMRLGGSHKADRAPGEATYYVLENTPGVPAVFPTDPGAPPPQYGGWSVPTLGACGGWIASAIDLARVLAQLFGEHQYLLEQGTMKGADAPMAIVSRGWRRYVGTAEDSDRKAYVFCCLDRVRTALAVATSLSLPASAMPMQDSAFSVLPR